MGIRGHISRILTAKYGSYISYVCLEEGKESADGQISAKYIEDVYNFSSINKETKVLGVLGSVAENSKSKFMLSPPVRVDVETTPPLAFPY